VVSLGGVVAGGGGVGEVSLARLVGTKRSVGGFIRDVGKWEGVTWGEGEGGKEEGAI
jgi:hypothetical protein